MRNNLNTQGCFFDNVTEVSRIRKLHSCSIALAIYEDWHFCEKGKICCYDRVSSTVLGNVIFQILSIYLGTLLYNKNAKFLKNLI